MGAGCGEIRQQALSVLTEIVPHNFLPPVSYTGDKPLFTSQERIKGLTHRGLSGEHTVLCVLGWTAWILHLVSKRPRGWLLF